MSICRSVCCKRERMKEWLQYTDVYLRWRESVRDIDSVVVVCVFVCVTSPLRANAAVWMLKWKRCIYGACCQVLDPRGIVWVLLRFSLKTDNQLGSEEDPFIGNQVCRSGITSKNMQVPGPGLRLETHDMKNFNKLKLLWYGLFCYFYMNL